MTGRSAFPEYARLWREQIDPKELAALQARAKNIERDARRKRLVDLALGFLSIGMVGVFLWSNPTSPQIRLGFALLVAGAAWLVWRRHQITRASRATAVDDPRNFFETAIENVRAEINLSTISLFMGVPVFISAVLLTKAAQGIDGVDWFLRLPSNINFVGIMVLVVLVLGHVYFARENIRLREQLRRLESMSREWDDQPARDLPAGS